MRVLPDEPAIDKLFDYTVPARLSDDVRVGSVVRIELHGRRVGGWVVEVDVTPATTATLRPLAKVSGWGPPPEVLELARWASWRWAGRPASFLRTASPDKVVRSLPTVEDRRPSSPAEEVDPASTSDRSRLIEEALSAPPSSGPVVVRLPPVSDDYDVALAAARWGNALILCPSVVGARHLGLRLRRAGVPVAILPREWAAARAGATVVGARSAAWAPVVDLAAVVLFDEHDETWQQEQAPTWHARDVVVERARRAGAPCLLVSPAPTLEALGAGRLVTPSRHDERTGWPMVDIVDRRGEDPGRVSLFSERLVTALRQAGRVVCVLNVKGRSRLLACVSCGELARCERCDASVVQDEAGSLTCRRCGEVRPTVCLSCGATRFKNLVLGVSRAREELEALARTPVVEVTGDDAGRPLPDARIYVGTEAVLHQVSDAEVVAFLDFDQELLAPRYRAAEEALALLIRAGRMVGGRGPGAGRDDGHRDGGRLLVQTRLPRHEVLQAALLGDPAKVAAAERVRRDALRFPPASAMAVVSGASAAAYVDAFTRRVVDDGDGGGGADGRVEVLGPSDGRWLLRAAIHQPLLDAVVATPRPGGRLRIEIDPLRI